MDCGIMIISAKGAAARKAEQVLSGYGSIISFRLGMSDAEFAREVTPGESELALHEMEPVSPEERLIMLRLKGEERRQHELEKALCAVGGVKAKLVTMD